MAKELEYIVEPYSFEDTVVAMDGSPISPAIAVTDLPSFDENYDLQNYAGGYILIYRGVDVPEITGNNGVNGNYMVGVRPVRKPRPECPHPIPSMA